MTVALVAIIEVLEMERMNWRDVSSLSLGQHIPTSPAHSVLLGEPEWGNKLKIEVEGLKTED